MPSLLKQKGLSATPFRKDVLAVFEKYDMAIPISTIEMELTSYDRITLYRTIKSFLQKGLIHEIAISGSEVNYALCPTDCDTETHEHQHVHFKCKVCDNVYCISVPQLPNIDLPDFEVDDIEIQVQGTCKECK